MFLRIMGSCNPRILLLGHKVNKSLDLRVGGGHDFSLASNFLCSVLVIDYFDYSPMIANVYEDLKDIPFVHPET